jgi:hypothetical protein
MPKRTKTSPKIKKAIAKNTTVSVAMLTGEPY